MKNFLIHIKDLTIRSAYKKIEKSISEIVINMIKDKIKQCYKEITKKQVE